MSIVIDGTGTISGINASNGLSSPQTGSALQVIQATTSTTTTTTSASFVATNLTASITPKFSTSKILVQVAGPFDSAATNSQAVATIYRGGTNLGGSGGFTNIFSSAGRVIGSAAMVYLDSPATTSSTTYTVYILCTNGSSIVFPQGSNPATITLTEVAA